MPFQSLPLPINKPDEREEREVNNQRPTIAPDASSSSALKYAIPVKTISPSDIPVKAESPYLSKLRALWPGIDRVDEQPFYDEAHSSIEQAQRIAEDGKKFLGIMAGLFNDRGQNPDLLNERLQTAHAFCTNPNNYAAMGLAEETVRGWTTPSTTDFLTFIRDFSALHAPMDDDRLKVLVHRLVVCSYRDAAKDMETDSAHAFQATPNIVAQTEACLDRLLHGQPTKIDAPFLVRSKLFEKVRAFAEPDSSRLDALFTPAPTVSRASLFTGLGGELEMPDGIEKDLRVTLQEVTAMGRRMDDAAQNACQMLLILEKQVNGGEPVEAADFQKAAAFYSDSKNQLASILLSQAAYSYDITRSPADWSLWQTASFYSDFYQSKSRATEAAALAREVHSIYSQSYYWKYQSAMEAETLRDIISLSCDGKAGSVHFPSDLAVPIKLLIERVTQMPASYSFRKLEAVQPGQWPDFNITSREAFASHFQSGAGENGGEYHQRVSDLKSALSTGDIYLAATAPLRPGLPSGSVRAQAEARQAAVLQAKEHAIKLREEARMQAEEKRASINAAIAAEGARVNPGIARQPETQTISAYSFQPISPSVVNAMVSRLDAARSEEDYGAILQDWMAHADYDKIGLYSMALDKWAVPNTLEALEFGKKALQFRLTWDVAQTSEIEVQLSKENADYCDNRHHAYNRGIHDCLTHIYDHTNQAMQSVQHIGNGRNRRPLFQLEGPTGGYRNSRRIPHGTSIQAVDNLASENDIFTIDWNISKRSIANGGTLQLQIGDWIRADVSPNGTGSNHWGLVALDENGQMVIVSRESTTIINRTFDEFTKLTPSIQIRRPYGQSPFRQHFDVTYSESRFIARQENGLVNPPSQKIMLHRKKKFKRVRAASQ